MPVPHQYLRKFGTSVGREFTKKLQKDLMGRNKDLTIIIPAASVGKRMRTIGSKSLIELRGEKVVQRQIRILHELHPHADIVVVTGFASDQVYKVVPSWVRVIENELYYENNVVRSIDLAIRASHTHAALIVYGDLVFDENALDFPLLNSTILVEDKPSSKSTVTAHIIDEKVTQFLYGTKSKWSQVVYLTGKEFSVFKELCSNKHMRNWFTHEVLNVMLQNGASIEAQPRKGKLVEIDNIPDINLARKIK